MTSQVWKIRYLECAKHFAGWSKDPSRKIGAVVIGSKGEIKAQGYNGFPRGIDDSEERLNNREVKYGMVVHAEMNAIFNATFNGVSLNGSHLYVYGLPVCSDCARGVIQVGINKVTMLTEEDDIEHWLDSWKRTKDMFDEVGIEYEWLGKDGVIIDQSGPKT